MRATMESRGGFAGEREGKEGEQGSSRGWGWAREASTAAGGTGGRRVAAEERDARHRRMSSLSLSFALSLALSLVSLSLSGRLEKGRGGARSPNPSGPRDSPPSTAATHPTAKPPNRSHGRTACPQPTSVRSAFSFVASFLACRSSDAAAIDRQIDRWADYRDTYLATDPETSSRSLGSISCHSRRAPSSVRCYGADYGSVGLFSSLHSP